MPQAYDENMTKIDKINSEMKMVKQSILTTMEKRMLELKSYVMDIIEKINPRQPYATVVKKLNPKPVYGGKLDVSQE